MGAGLLAGVNPPQWRFSLDATLNVACLVDNTGGLYFATPEDLDVENGNVLQQKPGLLQV